eukprot:7346109-Prymnesium_polylepis.1
MDVRLKHGGSPTIHLLLLRYGAVDASGSGGDDGAAARSAELLLALFTTTTLPSVAAQSSR